MNKTKKQLKEQQNVIMLDPNELSSLVEGGGYRTEEEVVKLINSIKRKDFENAIKVPINQKGELDIVDGHHRVDIAIRMRLKEIPIVLTDKTVEHFQNIENAKELLYNIPESVRKAVEEKYGGVYSDSGTIDRSNERSRDIFRSSNNNDMDAKDGRTTSGNDRLYKLLEGYNHRTSGMAKDVGDNRQELNNSSFLLITNAAITNPTNTSNIIYKI